MSQSVERAAKSSRRELESPLSAGFLLRRAVPALYAVDDELRVHFACGIPRGGPAGDRLPARVERIVRNLMETGSDSAECRVGVDGDMVVRITDLYSTTVALKGVIVEKLRRRDPLQEAIERFGITTRETQVLRLLLVGTSTAGIARQLHIAETTAVDHVRRIAVKTSSRGRGQIVARVLGFL